LPVLLRPAKTLREIAASDVASWLVPLLVLSLLALGLTAVSGPLRIQAALSQVPTLPADFQVWSPEEQQQFIEASKPNTGFLLMYGLPGLGALFSVWANWFLLSAVLHLALTLSGGRGSSVADFNLTAWASIPFGVRALVRIVAVLATNQLIVYPGLSGLITQELWVGMAGMFDLFLIWQCVLLVIGASAGSGITRAKAFWVVLVSQLIVMALSALPGYLLARLSSLAGNGPF
jgi:hypothetical protein